MAVLDQLPSSRAVGLRVLQATDAQSSDAAAVGAAVELDPSLVARLLKLANSSYYSPLSPVTTASRAVGLVGFAAVRALAVASAAGLCDNAALTDFWVHSAQAAHAASLLARHFGMKSNEAFALGLLHDLGEGLLCTADAATWGGIVDTTPTGTPERLAAERAEFGIDHAQLGAKVLRTWGMPDHSVAAVTHHHDQPAKDASVVVVAAEALLRLVAAGEDVDAAAEAEETLRALDVDPALVAAAGRRIESEAAGIVEALIG